MLRYIDFRFFFVTFALGIIVVILFQTPPQVVYKFPNKNSDHIYYDGESKSCYKYHANKVPCTENALPQPPLYG